MRPFSRSEYLLELQEFAQGEKAGFLYFRGRRRVGKSWILSEFAANSKFPVFLYAGKPDASSSETMRDFIAHWSEFTKDDGLSEIRPELLTWSRVFQKMLEFFKNASRPPVIIFDEIQWIAGSGSGFVGSLKEAWVNWERYSSVKVIICGSSQKFFTKFVGGENKLLRGMRTRSDLIVEEIPPWQVKKEFLTNWSDKQIAFTYFLGGGVPYYLNQLDPELGFVAAINKAYFQKTSIFLSEWEELLSLDFNKSSRLSSKRILHSLLGDTGLTAAEVEETSGLDQSTLQVTLRKLQDYNYLRRSVELAEALSPNEQKKNSRGVRYQIADFYLNFYFRVLYKFARLIEAEQFGSIFPRLIGSPTDTYYIPDFTGNAFERFCERAFLRDHRDPLRKKLGLIDSDYQVLSNVIVRNDKNWRQIDHLILHQAQRLLIVNECKWATNESLDHLENLRSIDLNKFVSREWQILRVLSISYSPSKNFSGKAKELDVRLISLEDYFG